MTENSQEINDKEQNDEDFELDDSAAAKDDDWKVDPEQLKAFEASLQQDRVKRVAEKENDEKTRKKRNEILAARKEQQRKHKEYLKQEQAAKVQRLRELQEQEEVLGDEYQRVLLENAAINHANRNKSQAPTSS